MEETQTWDPGSSFYCYQAFSLSASLTLTGGNKSLSLERKSFLLICFSLQQTKKPSNNQSLENLAE